MKWIIYIVLLLMIASCEQETRQCLRWKDIEVSIYEYEPEGSLPEGQQSPGEFKKSIVKKCIVWKETEILQ